MTEHFPKGLISAWLDRQLDAQEAALVESHLRQCESCQLLHKELSADARMFRELEVLAPPPSLWSRIEAGLQEPTRRRRFAWPQWPGVPWPRRQELMAMTAALLIILGGAVFIFLRQQAVSRSELAAIAQIDQAHAALAAKNVETYNPFRTASLADHDSNPFSRRGLDTDANPFAALRENR